MPRAPFLALPLAAALALPWLLGAAPAPRPAASPAPRPVAHPAARAAARSAMPSAAPTPFPTSAPAGRVTYQEHVRFAGWPNCVRLSNGSVELIATTDVGPRVIRFGYVNGRNLFHVYGATAGRTGGAAWNNYGGHRLWHGPEHPARSYQPDNERVAARWDARAQTLTLTPPAERATGIQKQLVVSLDAAADHATVAHKLTNRGAWPVELAPWALSVMAPGGRAIFPQEPFRPHPQALTPARPLVLWPYTDMKDARWDWGTRYVQLQQDPHALTKQKFGIRNSLGWCAYVLDRNVFVKRFAFDAEARYADFGCNNEAYTDADMLELESLGPLQAIAPGATATHTEHWFLGRAAVPAGEAGVDAAVMPLVRASERYRP